MSLDRLELTIRTLLGFTLSLLVAAIAVICLVEVVLRYVFGWSLTWYDEFVGYLLVWITFLGAVLAQSRGQHIGFENVLQRATGRTRLWMQLSNHAVLIAIHLVLLVYGAQLSLRFLREPASTLPVPMGLIYAVLPVSAALMLVVEGIRLARTARS